jgi:hypothetical protein
MSRTGWGTSGGISHRALQKKKKFCKFFFFTYVSFYDVSGYFRAHSFSGTVKGKGKGTTHLKTGHERSEGEKRYSSTLSLTLALDGGGRSTPRPGRLTPGKETRYPLYRRLGGPQGRSGRVWKISPTPEFDPRIVQPVTRRYTDWAIPAHQLQW